MFKSHYLTAALVVLSLAGGSAVASAAPIAHRHNSHAQAQLNEYRGLYDYAGPQAGYGYSYYGYWPHAGYGYYGSWDPSTWSTGNGYY